MNKEVDLERRVNITTVDNPFDPFTDFDSWFQFDEEKIQ